MIRIMFTVIGFVFLWISFMLCIQEPNPATATVSMTLFVLGLIFQLPMIIGSSILIIKDLENN